MGRRTLIEFEGQPRDVLCGAAEEALLIIKDDAARAPQKQAAVSELVSGSATALGKEDFNALVNLAKQVTDFDPAAVSGAADEFGAGAGLAAEGGTKGGGAAHSTVPMTDESTFPLTEVRAH